MAIITAQKECVTSHFDGKMSLQRNKMVVECGEMGKRWEKGVGLSSDYSNSDAPDKPLGAVSAG